MRTISRFAVACIVCIACWIPGAAGAENLCINGDFNVVTNGNKPFGWIYDFAWTKRTHQTDNPQYVSIQKRQGAKRNVLRLEMAPISKSPHEESIAMSNLIPFERGKTYKISFDGRTEGMMERIYVRGYKWKSGIRPHENPKLSELQNIYRGKPFGSLRKSWKTYSRDFPYFSKKGSSKLNLKHLKHVRFFALYIIIPFFETNPPGSIYIDNVKIQQR